MKKRSGDRFFKRSLMRYLWLILVPLVVFSVLQQAITIKTIRSETAQREAAMLLQLEEGMNYVLDELEAFVIAFDQETLYSSMEDIFKNPTLSYQRSLTLRIFRDWVKSIANARTYIDSIYVYIQNEHRQLLTSDEGLMRLDNLKDTAWMDAYLQNRSQTSWTLRRPYLRYDFEEGHEAETVSVFRTIRSGRGVIVLNLSPLYMMNQLQRLAKYQGQQVLVLGPDDELLFSSVAQPSIPATALVQLDAGHTFSLDGYSVTARPGSRYGWRYLSLIPNDVLFSLSNSLLRISMILLVACAALCFLLAYQHSSRNNKRLSGVYELIDAATEAKPLPPLPSRADDEYSYIEQNIIKSFIAQNAMERQLQEKNYELKSLEMLALQAQINPHFLVNTLNTMFWNSVALTGGQNKVSAMIEDLSQLLTLLVSDPNAEVPLADEADYLRCYIDIQSARFPDRFSFDQQIDERASSLRILKLVLQPLVENCVTHALRPDGPVHIHLSARIEGADLVITVSDDGGGISQDKLDELRSRWQNPAASDHIGLANTVKRLMLFYGLPSPVTLESTLDQGTTVRIALPLDRLS